MIYYSNGVASAKSRELFSKSFYDQLINAKDYNSCLELISSTFWVGETQDIDKMLDSKKQELFDFIKYNSPSREIIDFFLLAQDFDNLGVICRLMSVGKNLHTTLVAGETNPKDLACFLETGVTRNIDKALFKAFKNKPNDLSLSQIDLYFKQKKYETLKSKMKSQIMKNLLFDTLDLQNICVMLRCENKDVFLKNKVVSGFLNEKVLNKIFEKDESVLFELSGLTREIAEIAFVKNKQKAFAQIDRLASELPLLSIKPFAKETDTVAPFLEYCFSYLAQLKNIKMILSLKRNGVKCSLEDKILGANYGKR